MQYDDSNILYDQTNVNYEGAWAVIVIVSDTAGVSESRTQGIEKLITETINSAEIIAKDIFTRISDAVGISESRKTDIQNIISEAIEISESVGKTLVKTISDSVKIAESLPRTINALVTDSIDIAESLLKELIEKIKDAIGIIKQFVGIGIKKEKAMAETTTYERETLNDPAKQYDEATIQYDDSDTYYNNYISSEKPLLKMGKIKRQVSIEDKEDKPKIK